MLAYVSFEAGLLSFKHFLICEGCENAVFSHSFETEQHFLEVGL